MFREIVGGIFTRGRPHLRSIHLSIPLTHSLTLPHPLLSPPHSLPGSHSSTAFLPSSSFYSPTSFFHHPSSPSILIASSTPSSSLHSFLHFHLHFVILSFVYFLRLFLSSSILTASFTSLTSLHSFQNFLLPIFFLLLLHLRSSLLYLFTIFISSHLRASSQHPSLLHFLPCTPSYTPFLPSSSSSSSSISVLSFFFCLFSLSHLISQHPYSVHLLPHPLHFT